MENVDPPPAKKHRVVIGASWRSGSQLAVSSKASSSAHPTAPSTGPGGDMVCVPRATIRRLLDTANRIELAANHASRLSMSAAQAFQSEVDNLRECRTDLERI